jgi:two-component system, OmpR family, heavy metal sensor histidine kinase CusS
MSLKFKNRIALYNTLAVAITAALVFIGIYLVVKGVAYSHLDNNIENEKNEVMHGLHADHDSITISNTEEWDEAEHSQVEVNPTFLQVSDMNDRVIYRSANLINRQALANPDGRSGAYYDGKLNGQRIRIGQFPILDQDSRQVGKLTIAVSQQQTYSIISSLVWVLLISFPFVLLVQYIISFITASVAIKPVKELIKTASGINYTNISSRMSLPETRDEIYELALSLNELLARLEKSMLRQKQFTSDASHEIRTPLAAIRGTLEVLLRRERDHEVYKEKIEDVIDQVDRMDTLLGQLLQLARLDSAASVINNESINLLNIIPETMNKWEQAASRKDIRIHNEVKSNAIVSADRLYLELIIDNLISNAIKYGRPGGNVFLQWDAELRSLSVKDDGIGISSKNLPNIFERFYRVDESRSSFNSGNGLGLSIVKKLADLQQIDLSAESRFGSGSTFKLTFPN